MECSINNPALSLLMKLLVIDQPLKPSDSDQAVWAVHSCNSWFLKDFCIIINWKSPFVI